MFEEFNSRVTVMDISHSSFCERAAFCWDETYDMNLIVTLMVNELNLRCFVLILEMLLYII